MVRGFYNLRKHWSDWEATHEIALRAARELADPRAEADVMNGIGTLMKQTGRSAEATGYHQAALERRRAIDNKVGVCSSLDGLGHAYRDIGRPDDAVNCFVESLDIRHGTGDLKGQGWSYNNLGEAKLEAGDVGAALAYFQNALAARIEVGDQWGQGRTLHGMGLTHDALGELPEARERYAEHCLGAPGDLRQVGRRSVAGRLGGHRGPAGCPARARALWTEALAILTELGDLHADAVAVKIARSDAAG